MSSCAEALREEYFPQQRDSIVLWAERPQQLHMENQLGSRLEGQSHAIDFQAQILLKAVFNSLQPGNGGLFLAVYFLIFLLQPGA